MGSPISQVAASTQPQGKGFASPAQQPVRIDGLDQNVIQQGSEQWQEMSRSTQGNPGSQMMAPAVQPQQTRQGKGGSVTLPGQGGQPRMGQPNMYPNTVGQWDNASIQPQQSRNRGGKGKG
jgi:hypothetical protein